jgi:hypothetical protein
MKSAEREVPTLEGLDTLELFMCSGLQGLAELQADEDPNARVRELISNRTYRRKHFGLRGLFVRLSPRATSTLQRLWMV